MSDRALPLAKLVGRARPSVQISRQMFMNLSRTKVRFGSVVIVIERIWSFMFRENQTDRSIDMRIVRLGNRDPATAAFRPVPVEQLLASTASAVADSREGRVERHPRQKTLPPMFRSDRAGAGPPSPTLALASSG